MYVCMSMWAYIHTYILSFSLSRWRSRSFSRSCRAPSPLAPSSPSPKRDLLQCQKRPITVSKETYYRVKRDLLQCQKRPITVSKECSFLALALSLSLSLSLSAYKKRAHMHTHTHI